MYSYSITPNSITKFYSQGFEERLQKTTIPKKKICSNKRISNELSNRARKNIKQSSNNLIYLSKRRTIKNNGNFIMSNFKSAFITLKLPSKQMHEHSTITSQCLNQFLIQLRKKYNLKNYIWKAEIQSNGNIHYHLIIDQFVNYMAIRNYWNQAIQKLGYVTKYRNLRKNLTLEEYSYWRKLEGFKNDKKIYSAWEYGQKTDWKSPNSTDVKLIRNPKVISSYISKYMAKNEAEEDETGIKADSRKNLKGRLWFQSTSLSRLKSIVIREGSKINELFKLVLNNKKSHIISGDWFTKIFFNQSNFGANFQDFLKRLFLTNAHMASYPFPAEYHPSYYHHYRLLGV